MFCNQCGNELQPGYNHCPKCGRAVSWPTGGLAQGRLQRHLRTLGILWIIVGALWLVPSVGLMTLGGLTRLVIPGSEALAHNVGPFVMFLLGGSLLVVGVGGILVGWGLMHRQPWARMVAIILGIIILFHPPFGTALGIYTLWVLLSDEGGIEYQRLAQSA